VVDKILLDKIFVKSKNVKQFYLTKI
jgi:hypothetical protein